MTISWLKIQIIDPDLRNLQMVCVRLKCLNGC